MAMIQVIIGSGDGLVPSNTKLKRIKFSETHYSALKGVPHAITNKSAPIQNKSAPIQVMDWCCQATNYYLMIELNLYTVWRH